MSRNLFFVWSTANHPPTSARPSGPTGMSFSGTNSPIPAFNNFLEKSISWQALRRWQARKVSRGQSRSGFLSWFRSATTWALSGHFPKGMMSMGRRAPATEGKAIRSISTSLATVRGISSQHHLRYGFCEPTRNISARFALPLPIEGISPPVVETNRRAKRQARK